MDSFTSDRHNEVLKTFPHVRFGTAGKFYYCILYTNAEHN